MIVQFRIGEYYHGICFRYFTIGLTILLIGLIRLDYKSKSVSQDNLLKQPSCIFGVEYSQF